MSVELEPLPFQQAISELLRERHSDIWHWFAKNRLDPSFAENVRLEILRSTYRITPESHSAVYDAANTAAERLGVSLPITCYQASNPGAMNAALAFSPNELHIVFHGPVLEKLNELELLAVLGHEMGHHVLFSRWDQQFFLVDQILSAMSQDLAGAECCGATFRNWQLFTEIFCDRASLVTCRDPLVVVSALVKMMTGLATLDPKSYILQAEEILKVDQSGSQQLTHPEAFLRARAIQLWSDTDASSNETIARLIEGTRELESLDLLGQDQLNSMTRKLIEALLFPSWFRTESTLAHAKSFFPDFDEIGPTAPPDLTWSNELSTFGPTVHDYLCFVLLDFVNVDRDLEDRPIAAALTLAEAIHLKPRLITLAQREMRLRKRQLETIDADKLEILNKPSS